MSDKSKAQALVTKWIREDVRAMSAYKVTPAERLIKLDAMENPYSLPEEMTSSWIQRVSASTLNRYPDGNASELKSRIRQVLNVPEACELVLGNGSDELIQLIAMLVGGPNRVLMSPDPSFSMYEVISTITQSKFVGVPLHQDYSLDLDRMLSQIEIHQPACIFIAYPNNPTGNLFDEQQIRQVVEKAPGLVVLDEAYHSFSQTSLMRFTTEYDNVLLLRTFSKSGLAGLRLGMLIGKPVWTNEVEKLRLPYNINVLTQDVSLCVLERFDELKIQVDKILENRAYLFDELTSISGIDVFPSHTNFFLFRVDDSTQVFAALKVKGILIKDLKQTDGLLKNCLRVTVGTREENDAFLTSLKEILN